MIDDQGEMTRARAALPVTKPSLPGLCETFELLAAIWDSGQLTNGGPFHARLERRLLDELGVQHLALLNSGTMALQLGCACLGLRGQVLTTPFTFAATVHALYWNGIQPVFCDIEPENLTLDPARIEEAITPDVTGILPVHVFGCPCRVQEIDAIAVRHGIRVIYDAAHAFGVTLEGVPIGRFGDASAFSFHATKPFHTLEGGALACGSEEVSAKCVAMRNFGIADNGCVAGPGTNGKLNELQAAVGMLMVERFPELQARRRYCDGLYRDMLSGVPGIQPLNPPPGTAANHAYFPIMVDPSVADVDRDQLARGLRAANVVSRPYFADMCSHFPQYRELPSALPSHLPVAERASRQILCLPLFDDMEPCDVVRVAELVRSLAFGTRS